MARLEGLLASCLPACLLAYRGRGERERGRVSGGGKEGKVVGEEKGRNGRREGMVMV